MKRSDVIRFLILRSLGNFLVLFALFGVGMTFGPALYEEIHFRVDEVRGVHYTVGTIQQAQAQPAGEGEFGGILSSSTEKILVPKDPFFSVIIPKIGADAKVIPNVDSENPDEYLAALKQGIAHAKGSVFPGLKGTTYLFAHSTDNFWDVGRYNAIFYLLKDLTIGDDIVVFFQNHRFNYKVTDTKIIPPDQVDYLTHAQQTEEQLVLQTCWPPGTTLERLLVVAKRPGT